MNEILGISLGKKNLVTFLKDYQHKFNLAINDSVKDFKIIEQTANGEKPGDLVSFNNIDKKIFFNLSEPTGTIYVRIGNPVYSKETYYYSKDGKNKYIFKNISQNIIRIHSKYIEDLKVMLDDWFMFNKKNWYPYNTLKEHSISLETVTSFLKRNDIKIFEEDETAEILPADLEQKVSDFIKSNPNLDDSVMHKFAAEIGVDKSEVEEVAYSLLNKLLNQCDDTDESKCSKKKKEE